MGKKIHQTLFKLNKQEIKILNSSSKDSELKKKIYDKVPDKLVGALELAFYKAFEAIFINGTTLIEKTFNKEDLTLEHEARNYVIDKKETFKNIKKLDTPTKKNNLVNQTITTTSGLGMGLLGLGLPDIPILVATILRGIYQTASSYGVDYDTKEEKVYILRLISTALLKGERKVVMNDYLEAPLSNVIDLKTEIQITAKIMADALLVEKFIQGIPIVGVIGGVTNLFIYRKISKYSTLKYKTRYLMNKNDSGFLMSDREIR